MRTFLNMGPGGRILVAASLTHFAEEAAPDDVVVGASFAGAPTAAVPMARGVKGWIAHEAGPGKDRAGVSGLPLAQRFGIPAAAIATMTARLSDGDSLLAGRVAEANEVALALGVRPGQSGEEAARLMLAGPTGRAVEVAGLVDGTIHEVEAPNATRGGIYAVWSFLLVKERRSRDVFCVASHGGRVMAEYAAPVMPRGVIANDAGMGLDRSGADGLPVLDGLGIAAATVSADSARIGDALSTYRDGIISAVNPMAGARDVRVGMPARDAARLMLS
jgi:hypothetical protein